ncbi:MAG: hypothetical protein EA376_10940 [Phycisphaeraceae bacterium]|nr:MAG: hypothetical protein EA376_10940 [Phycisphaeraceae bacterium]
MTNVFARLSAVAAAGLFVLSAGAHAATYNFSAVSANSPVSVQIGEDQISMSVSDPGAGLVRFTIMNAGPLASSIANIYWEDSYSLLASIDDIIDSPNDVVFNEGGSPPSMPGSANFDVDYRVSAGPPPAHRGVGPGEELSVDFNLMQGVMFADVVAMLDGGGMRVGMHVIAFANGESEWFVNVIPAPPAVGLAGAGLLGLGAMRRRRGV